MRIGSCIALADGRSLPTEAPQLRSGCPFGGRGERAVRAIGQARSGGARPGGMFSVKLPGANGASQAGGSGQAIFDGLATSGRLGVACWMEWQSAAPKEDDPESRRDAKSPRVASTEDLERWGGSCSGSIVIGGKRVVPVSRRQT